MGLNPKRLRLYLVTDRALCADLGLVETVMAAVRGGVSFVQLRDKQASTAERVDQACALKAALAGTDVPLVINDDIEAAVAADVDGVHIGQGDDLPHKARAMIGPDKILGLSCETPAMLRAVNPGLVDYIGLGTVFATPTYSDHKRLIGLEGLAELCSLATMPTVAIGGLKSHHARDVFAAGANGLAVVSAICGQDDPEAAARAFQSHVAGE